jgi:hypothetical protein
VYPEEPYVSDASSHTLNVVVLPNTQSTATQHNPSNNMSDIISQTIFDGSFDTIIHIFADIILDLNTDSIWQNIVLVSAQLVRGKPCKV